MTEQECIKYIKEYGDFETAFKTGTSEFQDMGFGCAIKLHKILDDSLLYKIYA